MENKNLIKIINKLKNIKANNWERFGEMRNNQISLTGYKTILKKCRI